MRWPLESKYFNFDFCSEAIIFIFTDKSFYLNFMRPPKQH